MIRLRNLQKKFGQRLAVDDLTLEVPAGEIYGLLGHNGAGKSTAIGMMLGQVWPTGGEIEVCGFDVTTQRQRALRKVGAIFETPAFYDYLSGWRNLEILSTYTAPTPPERLRKVIAWVGLSGREKSAVKTYSHGMRARLALAQALLPQPELLILDEPGDGLDPEGIDEMRQTILQLHREFALTILLSSHLLNEVEQLCTRISVMNQGRKVFEGPLTQVKQDKSWIRLKVGNFKQAAATLRESGMIVGARAGELVELAHEVASDQVVRKLVESGMPVFEVTPIEQSLEEFYLTLMKGSEPPERRNSDQTP